MEVESASSTTILDDGATLMKQNRKDTPEKTLKNEKSELKTRMNKRRSKSGTKKKKTLFKVESAPVPDNRKLLQSRIMMTYPASIVEKIFRVCNNVQGSDLMTDLVLLDCAWLPLKTHPSCRLSDYMHGTLKDAIESLDEMTKEEKREIIEEAYSATFRRLYEIAFSLERFFDRRWLFFGSK